MYSLITLWTCSISLKCILFDVVEVHHDDKGKLQGKATKNLYCNTKGEVFTTWDSRGLL